MLLCSRSDPMSLISMAYVEQQIGFVVSSPVIRTKKSVTNSQFVTPFWEKCEFSFFVCSGFENNPASFE
jgi:hypothetical protein